MVLDIKPIKTTFVGVMFGLMLVGLQLDNLTMAAEPAASKQELLVMHQAHELQDWKGGIAMLERYLSTHPNSVAVVACCAKFSNQLGLEQPSETIKYANRYFSLKPQPVDHEIYKVRARAYLFSNQPKKAMLDLTSAKKLAPTDVGVLMMLSDCLNRLGQRKEALAVLNQYLLTHPTDPEVTRTCANICHINGQPRECIKYATRYFALKPEPIDPDVYLVRANSYLMTNQPQNALLDTNAAMKMKPNDAGVWMLHSDSLNRLGRVREALDGFSHAVQLKAPNALLPKAEMEYKLGLFQEANQDYLEFAKTTKNFDVANMRAFELYQKHKFNEALFLIDGLIGLSSPEVRLHELKANALFKLGRTKESMQESALYTKMSGKQPSKLRDFNSSLEKNWDAELLSVQKMIQEKPKEPALYLSRANCFLHLERYHDALADYQKFPDLVAQEPVARAARAECNLRIGHNAEALKDLAALNEINPTADSLANQGRCLIALAKYGEAVTCFSQALKLRPLSASFFCWRGDCFRRLKNYPRAINDFSDAMTLSPRNCIYAYSRGLCHLEAHQNTEAIRDFTTALKDPRMQSFVLVERAKAYENLGQKELARKDKLAASAASKAVESDFFR